MKRLSAEQFLEQVRLTGSWGVVWFPYEEPIIYTRKIWVYEGCLGPDPAVTDDVLYSVFLAKLRLLLGKKYRIDKQVSQLIDCEAPLVGKRFLTRICWLIRWGHEIHFCVRPRGKHKGHFGDHRCRCKKTWPMTAEEKA